MREAWAGLALAVVALHAIAGSPASAVEDAYADCQKLPPDVAAHALYLWLGDVPPKDVQNLVALTRYQLNAVSTTPDLVQAVLVPPLLLRVDRRDPGPAFDVALQKSADFDPIFHLQVEAAEYTDEPRKVSTGGDGYSKWVRNDAGDWVKPDTVSKTVRVKTASKKRSVMAQRHVPDCPDCRGWLPDRETEGLCLLTQSRSPILSAQWLLARLSRQLSLNNKDEGTGYYDFQGIKSRDDYFKILHVHNDDDVHVFRGVFIPGFSLNQNGRGVEGIDALFGKRWVSLDPNAPDGDRNVAQQLKRGDLVHDAEEHIAPGPNGIEKDLLCTDKGVIQPTAPDFISGISNPSYGGTDLRIHVWLGCKECHAKQILLPLAHEWARHTFVGPIKLQSPDYQVNKDFQSQLFSDLDGERLFSAALMIRAEEQVSGMKIDALCTAFTGAWKSYAVTPLTADDVGRCHGVDGKMLTAAVQRYYAAHPVEGIAPALTPLLDPKGMLPRQTSEEFYAVVESYLWSAKP